MGSFTDLKIHKSVQKALRDMELTTPTPIQEEAFKPIMSGRDLMGIAQTGTGKTLAYLLPLLSQWNFDKNKEPQIIIIVPTRELVIQIVAVIERLTDWMNFHVRGVFGGVNINTQREILMDGCDAIVATPGRFLDLAKANDIKIKKIKKLVIDEADEMLNLGFKAQLEYLLDILPQKRQNLLFSATTTPEVEELIQVYFKSPLIIQSTPFHRPLENIEQFIYKLPNHLSKLNLLIHFLDQEETFSKVLIFAENKKLADLLFQDLDDIYPEEVGVIHSNKAQNNRFNTVASFQEDGIRILVATDVMARGIDVSNVSHVINFSLPKEPEDYIHRIGRTGRAYKKGTAISFVNEKEELDLMGVENLMEIKIPVVEVPKEVEITELLMDYEMPVITMPFLGKMANENIGESFHERSAKRQKTNQSKTRAQRMKVKYKKPKSRGSKK